MLKKILIIIIYIIALSIIIFAQDIKKYKKEYKEKEIVGYYISNYKNINSFNKVNSVEYIAIIEIPKINLAKLLYDIKNENNNIDKNLEIMKESKMPDINDGNLIVGGHSGSSKYSYFNDLYKLELEDLVYVYYKDVKYTYKVINKYTDNKDGSITIKKSKNKSTLTLFTCKNDDKSNYLVFILELIEKS